MDTHQPASYCCFRIIAAVRVPGPAVDYGTQAGQGARMRWGLELLQGLGLEGNSIFSDICAERGGLSRLSACYYLLVEQLILQLSRLTGKPLFSHSHCLMIASTNSFRVFKHNVKCAYSVLSKIKSSTYFSEGHISS